MIKYMKYKLFCFFNIITKIDNSRSFSVFSQKY